MSIDIISLGEGLAVPIVAIFSILYARSAIRAGLKSELKANAVEKIFETMGFRNLKLTDFNAGKLDDTGFMRFRQVMSDISQLYGPGGAPNKNASVIAQLQQLAQLGAVGQQTQKPKVEDNSGGVPA